MAIRPSEPLIYDRTLSDVNNDTDKGNYNDTDLNRVEAWSRYLADILKQYGYYVDIKTYTDWIIGLGKDKMQSHINRIRKNVKVIRDGFFYSSPIDFDDEKTSVNYVDANNIEKLLYSIDHSISNMEKSFRYADFLVAGEDLGLIDIQV